MSSMRGFTLLELLVAITVSMIVLTIGVPSFMRMITQNQRVGHTAEVFSSLNFARSEAIARNNEVVMCKSADGATCTTGGAWTQGWIVYANLDGLIAGDEPDTGSNEAVLQATDALGERFSLSSTEFSDRVVYLPSGRASMSGSFTLCSNNDELKGRLIEITSTGRPRATPTSCSGGGDA